MPYRSMYQLRKAVGILLLSVLLMAGTIAAQNAVDDVKSAADTVGSGAKEVGESIASGATSAGEAIASGATSAGEAIASGVTSAGEAIGNAAQDAFTSSAWVPSHLVASLMMLCAAFMQ